MEPQHVEPTIPTDGRPDMRVPQGIRTGTAQSNGAPSGLSARTGGNKGSGMGRGTGTEGLDASTEPKAIGLPPAYAKQLVAR